MHDGSIINRSRVSGLANPYNRATSDMVVSVFPTELHDFVLIEEPEDNPGMSITNGAEYFCPQIAARMGLAWSRCVFVEVYPPSKEQSDLDPTFDRILFQPDLLTSWSYGSTPDPLPAVELVGWRPLGRPFAEQLQRHGVAMTRHVGRTGVFRMLADGSSESFIIAAYDGRRYYRSDSKHPIDGELLHVL